MLRTIAIGAVGLGIISLSPSALGGTSNNHTPHAQEEQTESNRVRETTGNRGDFVSLEELEERLKEEEIERRELLPASIEAPVEPTRAGGSRGCKQSQSLVLTLLTPSGATALTGVGHPTFYWHVSETVELPMLFTLVERDGAKAILEKTISQPQSGITGFKLPADIPELEVGKEYQWSVSLICNQERPSADVVGRAWIRRVNLSPELKQSLASANSSQERGQVLAQAGIWYDALANFDEILSTWQQPWEELWRIVVSTVQPGADVQEN